MDSVKRRAEVDGLTETEKKPEETQEPKERGTAWMGFYVNWRFPIGFVLGGLAILSYIVDFESGSYNDLIVLYVLLFDIPFYIFGFFVYSAMRKRTKDGYEMNTVYLVLEALLYSVSYGIQGWSIGNALLALVVVALVWTLPNYVYFGHRKYLFDVTAPGTGGPADAAGTMWWVEAGENFAPESNPPQGGAPAVTAAPEGNAPENAPEKSEEKSAGPEKAVLYCKKCGAKLLPNSVYCDQCGAKI